MRSIVAPHEALPRERIVDSKSAELLRWGVARARGFTG